MALLRRQSEWLACAVTAKHEGDDDAALSSFDRLSIREAAKFDDREPSATVDAALAAAGVGGSSAPPTIAVVCLVACLMGDREEQIATEAYGDAAAARQALEELAAAANGDEEVFAFELFWVPGDDKEILELDEVAQDWPELMTC